jgi:type VI secretion system protein ImpH
MGQLMARPQRFSFDAAVRVLTFARRQPQPADAVRFESEPGMGYASAEVAAVTRANEAQPRVSVALIGLTGPSGVLPRQYSEAVIATLRGRSRALHTFLSLLSHRMVAAFAGAGAKYRPQRAADTAVLAGATDEAARRGLSGEVLLALTGYATPHLADRLLMGADPLRHYAGLFASRPRSADRLEALASDWLGRPVTVEQFAGGWLALPVDQRSRLAHGPHPGTFDQLGGECVIGLRAWDPQARIVLRIGPLDLASFEALLPNRPMLRSLVALVRAFIGFETGFAVNPVLAWDAMKPLVLRIDTPAPPRLGWNTWVPGNDLRRGRDAADAIFEAELVEESAG